MPQCAKQSPTIVPTPSCTPSDTYLRQHTRAGLQLCALGCERGGRILFSGLAIHAGPGVLLRVLGANGSGKTSLLRMVCGLLPPAQGQVLWNGTPIRQLAEEFGRQMVYLGHAAAIKDDLTGIENLVMACQLGGLVVTPAQAAAALQHSGVGRLAQLPTRLLSQGQRRRVALARLVLCSATPLWVLDEPFNALDRLATDWLCTLITAHLGRGGMVVLTSHQQIGLDDLSGQIVVNL